jgi:hypothetical protein
VKALLAAALALLPAIAVGNPPPPGSEDAQLLGPYGQAIHDAQRPEGGRCCDVPDGTAVDARIAGDHWEVKFRNARFPDAPKGWTPVPDGAVLRSWSNPTGEAIVWWYFGSIRCFAPASGS